MGKFKVLRCVLVHDLKKGLTNYRSILAVPLVFMIVHRSSEAIRMLCAKYQATASPLPFFTYMTSTATMSALLLLCWLMLMCDAPFIDDTQPYILLRSGRILWSFGQMLYIFTASLIYWAWVVACCILVLYPYVGWDPQWGKVYYSLTYYESYGLDVSKNIQACYSVMGAFGLSLGFNIALCIFLAQLTYLVNLLTSRMYGALIATALVLLHWSYYMWGSAPWAIKASPVTLAALNWLEASTIKSNYPPVSYAIQFFIISIAVLTALCVLAIRRRAICVQQPV